MLHLLHTDDLSLIRSSLSTSLHWVLLQSIGSSTTSFIRLIRVVEFLICFIKFNLNFIASHEINMAPHAFPITVLARQAPFLTTQTITAASTTYTTTILLSSPTSTGAAATTTIAPMPSSSGPSSAVVGGAIIGIPLLTQIT